MCINKGNILYNYRYVYNYCISQKSLTCSRASFKTFKLHILIIIIVSMIVNPVKSVIYPMPHLQIKFRGEGKIDMEIIKTIHVM